MALVDLPGGPKNLGFSPLHEGDTSVAFTRRSDIVGGAKFQSPSRGGHLRGAEALLGRPQSSGFSPLHEGDTSVAMTAGSHTLTTSGFSPLHEGDTSVAPPFLHF